MHTSGVTNSLLHTKQNDVAPPELNGYDGHDPRRNRYIRLWHDLSLILRRTMGSTVFPQTGCLWREVGDVTYPSAPWPESEPAGSPRTWDLWPRDPGGNQPSPAEACG